MQFISVGRKNEMKQEELLSIIVPVFQTKEYLPTCIESILNQGYQNIEIILVDDGSTDGSSEECEVIKKKDSRIKVIHTLNKGPFQARKMGVENAQGRVVTFVDSDDWIDKGIYQEMMMYYDKYAPDVIAYAYRINESGACSECSYPEGIYSQKEIERKIMPNMMMVYPEGERKLNPSVCCKIFKREIYEKVTKDVADRITLGEDALVTYPAMCIANSVYISNKIYYHYRMNETSCTHIYSWEKLEEIKSFQTNMTRLMSRYGALYNFSLQMDCYVRSFLEAFLVNKYGIHRTASTYLFPYKGIAPDSKVQIYGAGEVGKSYYCSLKQTRYAELVGWYDQNYSGIDMYDGEKIRSPEKIIEAEADTIIIAVLNPQIALDIREYLLSMGVDQRKIFWEKPLLTI